jgi:hypothetical protein
MHNEESSAGRFAPAGFRLRLDQALETMLAIFQKNGSETMLRISVVVAVLSLIALTPAGISTASADNWGCSYEKCLQSCATAGGKNCSGYCNKALKDKQLSKVCK